LISGGTFFALKDKKTTAIGALVSFALAYVLQK
jgi:hypothetical protein